MEVLPRPCRASSYTERDAWRIPPDLTETENESKTHRHLLGPVLGLPLADVVVGRGALKTHHSVRACLFITRKKALQVSYCLSWSTRSTCILTARESPARGRRRRVSDDLPQSL